MVDCVFCDFIAGRKVNRNGFPFIVLNETPHSVSFLSIDTPAHEDGHLLVIPKEHFQNLEDVPQDILADLIGHVALSAKVTRKKHRGCNVLLNNGHAAGQEVMHVHFHVVPRDEHDNIAIEVWKIKSMTSEDFMKLSERLKKDFDDLKNS
jgi:histidine triad (HIT) family protein